MSNKRCEGFTLAELLIIVAIIAVLVAVAIPIFNSQLEKSREATDLANIRAAYAECCVAVISGEIIDEDGFEAKELGGTFLASKKVLLKQKKDKWQMGNVEVGGVILDAEKLVNIRVGKSGEPVEPVFTVMVYDDGDDPDFFLHGNKQNKEKNNINE